MLGHAKTTRIYLNASVNELADSMRRLGSGSQPLHDVAREQDEEHPAPVQQSDRRNSMVN